MLAEMTDHCHFHHIVATNNIFDIDVVTLDCRNLFIRINIIHLKRLRNSEQKYLYHISILSKTKFYLSIQPDENMN